MHSTILGQIAKKVLLILVDRQRQDFSFTGEELTFPEKHETDIPAVLDKLYKEKIAHIKKIGVLTRKITRAQEKQKKKKPRYLRKANNNFIIFKLPFDIVYRHIMIVIVFM